MKNTAAYLLHLPLQPIAKAFCILFFLSLVFAFLPKAGAQTVNESQDLSNENLTDSAQVILYIAQARDIHRKSHNDSLETHYAEKAIDKAFSMGDTLLYAKALDNLGLLNRYHQRYEEAIALHGKAFKLVVDKELAPPLSKMIYANNAGVASRYAQQLDKAVLYYKEALKIAEEQNDQKNIAIASNGLGNTFLSIPNRSDDALVYFQRALAASKAQNNSLGVAMNYLSISDFYNQKENFTEARNYLDQLLAINLERKDTFGLAITYEFFGLNYFDEGINLQKSKDYYLRSLELFRNMRNTHKQADVLLHLGEGSRKNKEFSAAIKYYQQSAELAQTINNNGLLMHVNFGLSAVYEELADFDKALQYYKLSEAFKDSVALQEQETQIAAIERRFALEKKESQIALLEKDKVLQETKLLTQEETLKSRNFILLMLAIGLIAIVIIAMMQFRNIKIKKKSNVLLRGQNQQILQQKEEIEQVNKQLQFALQEIVDQQKENEERRIKLLESKFENKIQNLTLQSLESQMNPHFLFNGMNAVRWLVIQNKNEEAMKYLDTFANLLRLSLTSNRKNVIELSEELRTTSLYLEIEKLRFDSEFSFSVNIASTVNVDHIMVPPKILQPLAENAVKHGLLPSRKSNKKLEINVLEAEKGIHLEVIDNGRGFKSKTTNEDNSRPDGTHLGLKLIEERLLIYNQQNKNLITFDISAQYDEGGNVCGTIARIFITVPQIVPVVVETDHMLTGPKKSRG